MKKSLFFCFVVLSCLLSCADDCDDNVVICPPMKSIVFTLMVDYTTNEFLGGYQIDLHQELDSVELVCAYNSPCDFGDVTWLDKKTETKLFSGTIVWMGKGKRGFPEKTEAPSSHTKLKNPAPMPTFIPLYHDEYQFKDPEVNYKTIWDTVKHLQNSSWVQTSTPAYIYLYQPSVGDGNPKDWYWVIFLKY